MSFTRFALYYLPPDGPLAEAGAAWLGWDVARARAVAQPGIDGIGALTEAPRKYGFHATLKPPFRLAEGRSPADLAAAVADLAATLAPAQCAGLRLDRLGRFLALVPEGDAAELARVAGACVRAIDGFRAPATEAELARRRQARLTARQEARLARWGYPYVMEEFRFHMTLTGRLGAGEMMRREDEARAHLPPLPAPFRLDQIALVGEREDGFFELVQRHALTG